ncbi:uncharacterized protein [Anas acuta]|uniref:uncharacterized protein n=1 Tax=Anas acuta TaxID=28680 RepID=UPI0035C932DF
MIMTQSGQLLWQAHWQRICDINAHTPRPLGDPLEYVTTEQLMGVERFASVEMQIQLGPEICLESMRAARAILQPHSTGPPRDGAAAHDPNTCPACDAACLQSDAARSQQLHPATSGDTLQTLELSAVVWAFMEWMTICRDRACQGIPANAYRGPCYLGRLRLFVPHHQDCLNISKTMSRRVKRGTQGLTTDCKDDVELRSATARIFASFFTLGVTASRALTQIEKLTCWTVKQFNATTDILSQMMDDMDSLQHSVLQNRATIDFLLLAQGHGCEDFEGICCFNLSDHSELIHRRLDWLKNM